MKHKLKLLVGAAVTLAVLPAFAHAEILAMMNYETKSADSLKALKNPVAPKARREGIAIIDVDPNSKNFGKIVTDLPLPPDTVAHHIFYNKDASKAYITALGKSELRVIDMKRKPYKIKTIAVPGCTVGEDVVFSADNKTWYLSCMGSQSVIVGDAVADKPLKTVALPKPYPHGIAIHDGIDRVLMTSSVRASDLGDAGETISAIKASTGEVTGTYKVSTKPSPGGEAPVEVTFVPGSNPPVAYVTNMYAGTLSAAVWDTAKKDFNVKQVFDFGPLKAGVPLEMYFNKKGDRMYVTTAKPGQFHIFELGKDAASPKLLKSIPAAEGAHHVAFTLDGRYVFVQNALLNLPGMSDGSITVIDLQKEVVVGSVDTLKNKGLNPNSIVLLPQWNDPAGH
jgi:DNA-binding beta-propeller fold protein YncE